MTNDTLASEKKRLRLEAKQRRLTLDTGLISQRIRAVIEQWNLFQTASIILAYAALPGEVDLLPLVKQFPNKAWYLPRVLPGGRLEFHRFYPGDPLHTSEFKIYEPFSTAPTLEPNARIDLIFVPALMLDKQGVRLGFGAGYYDRFLSRLALQTTTASPIPETLLTEKLPKDSWDIPMHWGLTESGVLKFPL